MDSLSSAAANNRVNRTANKLRLLVPSALRVPAAGYAERSTRTRAMKPARAG